MSQPPPVPASWLAAGDYTAGDAFMREKSSIFATDWLPLCAMGQCANPGDFIAHTLGGWPLVAVRDTGGLRAFRNTCRHQNMLVVEQPSGNASILQCRYHGWRYRLDGSFHGAPALVAPSALDPAATALQSVHTREWHGVLFGSLAPVAPAFELPGILGGLAGSAATLPYATSSVTDVACNWKLVIEQRVADGWLLGWPLLVARREEGANGLGVMIEQVVPRSFLRTRVVSHVFAAEGARAIDAIRQSAVAALKATTEDLQKRAAAGEAQMVDGTAAHAFRAKVLDRRG